MNVQINDYGNIGITREQSKLYNTLFNLQSFDFKNHFNSILEKIQKNKQYEIYSSFESHTFRSHTEILNIDEYDFVKFIANVTTTLSKLITNIERNKDFKRFEVIHVDFDKDTLITPDNVKLVIKYEIGLKADRFKI